MNTPPSRIDPRRRRFLFAAAAAPAAGVAAVIGLVAPRAVAVPAMREAAAPAAQGYRETEHIRTYYRTAAF